MDVHDNTVVIGRTNLHGHAHQACNQVGLVRTPSKNTNPPHIFQYICRIPSASIASDSTPTSPYRTDLLGPSPNRSPTPYPAPKSTELFFLGHLLTAS